MTTSMKQVSQIALGLGLILTVVLVTGVAGAQTEESEETRLAAEKAKRRHYAGGKDEQELTVQAVLPQPSRYPADPKAAPTETAKEPVQDDLHD